jgi:hypothetical protein
MFKRLIIDYLLVIRSYVKILRLKIFSSKIIFKFVRNNLVDVFHTSLINKQMEFNKNYRLKQIIRKNNF